MTWRRLLAITGPAAAALGLSVTYWNQVPERIPIHWDENGNPNGWAPRAVGLLLLPIAALLVSAIVSWAIRKGKAERTADALAAGTGTFMLALHHMTIQAAMSPGQMLSVNKMMVLMGALFVGLGLAMPHISPNRWAGVRTPWTLRDEVNWKLTHRFAAWTMGIGGVVSMIAGIALEPALAVWGSIAAILIGSLLPIGYSYVIDRMRRRPRPS